MVEALCVYFHGHMLHMETARSSLLSQLSHMDSTNSNACVGLSRVSSKEVWKLNFRQYGEMKMAQPGRNSDVEKVSREKIRDGEDQRWRKSEERRCRCAKR